jgi:hypothetical protein
LVSSTPPMQLPIPSIVPFRIVFTVAASLRPRPDRRRKSRTLQTNQRNSDQRGKEAPEACVTVRYDAVGETSTLAESEAWRMMRRPRHGQILHHSSSLDVSGRVRVRVTVSVRSWRGIKGTDSEEVSTPQPCASRDRAARFHPKACPWVGAGAGILATDGPGATRSAARALDIGGDPENAGS